MSSKLISKTTDNYNVTFVSGSAWVNVLPLIEYFMAIINEDKE